MTPHSVLFPVVMTVMCLTLSAGDPFDLSWYTIDGGGFMRSTSDDGIFDLGGTIGQPDAGTMAGGDFRLTGGFWFEIPLGDCNANGVVGLLDHVTFVACLYGPTNTDDAGGDCACFDVNRNGTIDLADFSRSQRSFGGE